MAEFEVYDPHKLVEEVQELLRARGLHPDGTSQITTAHTGACMLLRGLGITPALDMVETLVRSVEKPWADRD